MTGGSLPGMTWQKIMAYAHQGIEIKPLPGVTGPAPSVPQVASAPAASGSNPAPQRPTMLTKRSIEVLLRVERMMENATRALATASAPQRGAEVGTPNAVAAAAESGSRGN
jgi:penicillin-binding protein 1A